MKFTTVLLLSTGVALATVPDDSSCNSCDNKNLPLTRSPNLSEIGVSTNGNAPHRFQLPTLRRRYGPGFGLTPPSHHKPHFKPHFKPKHTPMPKTHPKPQHPPRPKNDCDD